MSVKTMAQVWELDLDTSAKFVLLAIADHTDHDGRNAYPSVARIAWKTGLSVRQVRRIYKQLRDDNILQADKVRTGNTTIYSVHCENGKQLEPLHTPDTMSPPDNDEIDDTPDTHVRGGVTPMSPKPSIKPSKDLKELPAPLSTESVPDGVDNFPSNQSSDNVQFIINTTEQLAQLDLTTPQRTVLIGWLVSHAHTEHDFAPYTGKRTQVMNNLAKQGYLTTNSNGDFSTRLQSTKPKSILFSLTYADLDTAPPEGKKPTDKPFWEGVAAMYCWNDNGLDDWRKYAEIATPNQIATLNNKIKLTCLALDALHLDDPFTVEEFRWIINHWLHTKFKTVPITERRFAVSGEAIANNWNAMRVSYKLYKQQQTQTEL